MAEVCAARIQYSLDRKVPYLTTLYRRVKARRRRREAGWPPALLAKQSANGLIAPIRRHKGAPNCIKSSVASRRGPFRAALTPLAGDHRLRNVRNVDNLERYRNIKERK
ncbi:hypothetical protein EVAR_22162_1 [Eumeta japonica]|uniref:Uncharacterized protein n=1 Tax=Eumeta variegata TaxID=151549 RepID=A0A4C1VZ16_EUMVA|nr:hypothetical protein EVAR_22162_1 [Eumeta japonica]